MKSDQMLKKKYANKKRFSSSFRGSFIPYRRFIGWAAVGLSIGCLVLLLLDHYRTTPEPQLEQKKLTNRVIRKKIAGAAHLMITPAFKTELQPLREEKSLSPTESAPLEKTITVANNSETLPPVLPSAVVGSALEKESKTKRKICRENWLLAQASSDYTIQIMGVQNEQTLLSFVDEHVLPAHREIAYYQTRYKGKKWYPLLYGVYATKKEAYAAVKELPADIQQASPWVRKMSSVQNNIRKSSN
jgi:hypothetical protein